MADFNRTLEGFFATFALVALAIAVLLLIFGGFFLDFGQYSGDSEILLLITVVCALQAIYYQRKAQEVEAKPVSS